MTLAERIHNYFKTARHLNLDTMVSTIRVGMPYGDWVDDVAAELDIDDVAAELDIIDPDDCLNAIMELEAKECIFVITPDDDGSFVCHIEVND